VVVADPTPCLYIIAGLNGAGKSSVAGAAVLARGGDYYDPDIEAAHYIEQGWSLDDANSQAWKDGVELLRQAVAQRKTWIHETTLASRTIKDLLLDALGQGMEVRIWYVGLDSVALHIARAQARAALGGHEVAPHAIESRVPKIRDNLIELAPLVTELRVFDNSVECDVAAGEQPRPVAVLHVVAGRVVTSVPRADVPAWADPVLRAVDTDPASLR
jgi:predicted ABC-type ATPase